MNKIAIMMKMMQSKKVRSCPATKFYWQELGPHNTMQGWKCNNIFMLKKRHHYQLFRASSFLCLFVFYVNKLKYDQLSSLFALAFI